MTTFEEYGFLADELADWAASRSPRVARHIALAFDVSRFIQSRLYKIGIPRADCHERRARQEPIVVTLALRGIALFQGVFLLARRGMAVEAAIMCRSLLDLLFKCVAIPRQQEALLTYMGEDEHYRLTLARNLLQHPELFEGHTTAERLRIVIKQLKHRIRKSGQKRQLSMRKWAQHADMLQWYRTIYAQLSNFVHAGVRNLEPMFILDENRELDCFAFEPHFDETTLTCATEAVLILWATLERELGRYQSDELLRFRDRLVELVDDAARDHT